MADTSHSIPSEAGLPAPRAAGAPSGPLLELRIHHFIDIIRDFGAGVEIRPHPYGHSGHRVAESIRNDPGIRIRILMGTDDICAGCQHLSGRRCTDVITHRADFASKEAFNDHIDQRILGVCGIRTGEVHTVARLCRVIDEYLAHINWIYEGNDAAHTALRAQHVRKGLENYRNRNALL